MPSILSPPAKVACLFSLLALGGLWWGCGDSGPAGFDSDPPDDPPPTDTTPPPSDTTPTLPPGQVLGVVDPKEVGGSGIQILSALDTAAVPVDTGAFQLTVADSSAQVILAIDGEGEPRALAYSIPEVVGGSRSDTLQLNARSTALAAIMLTPGILTIDPQEAKATVEELEAYACFPTLVGYLASQLPTNPLGTVARQDPTYESHLQACLDEWEANHPPPAPPSSRASDSYGGLARDTAYHGAAAPNTFFEVKELGKMFVPRGGGYPGQVLARMFPLLSNNNWRLVQVYRRDFPTDDGSPKWYKVGRPNTMGKIPLMGGTVSLSLGSALTLQVGKPTTLLDTLELRRFREDENFDTEYWIEKSEYWVRGPGYLPEELFPTDFPPEFGDATSAVIQSHIAYIALPLIAAASSVEIELDSKKLNAIAELWEIIKNTAAVEQARANLATFGQGDKKAASRVALDLMEAFFQALMESTAARDLLSTKFGISTVKVQAMQSFAALLGLLGQAMNGVNFGMAVLTWYTVPSFAHLDVWPEGVKYHIRAEPENLFDEGDFESTIGVIVEGLDNTSKVTPVVFKVVNEGGWVRNAAVPPSEGTWLRTLERNTDHHGIAEVVYKTGRTVPGFTDTIAITIMDPKEPLSSGIKLFEDTVYLNVTGEDPENLLVVHTCNSVPEYSVWVTSVCDDPNPNNWQIKHNESPWTLIGMGSGVTTTFYVGDSPCILITTESVVHIDAVEVPGFGPLQHEVLTTGGFVLKPTGSFVGNMHKHLNPDTTNCQLPKPLKDYLYVNMQTGAIINDILFTGGKDGQCDELGWPPPCWGSSPPHMTNGYIVIPNPQAAGASGGGD